MDGFGLHRPPSPKPSVCLSVLGRQHLALLRKCAENKAIAVQRQSVLVQQRGDRQEKLRQQQQQQLQLQQHQHQPQQQPQQQHRSLVDIARQLIPLPESKAQK